MRHWAARAVSAVSAEQAASVALEDIFDMFGGAFGRLWRRTVTRRSNQPRKGRDLQKAITITFEEAAFGTKKQIELNKYVQCPTCKGEGAKLREQQRKPVRSAAAAGQIKTYTENTFRTVPERHRPCDQMRRQQVKIIEAPCKDCGGTGRGKKKRYNIC